METRSKVSGGSEPLKKAIGADTKNLNFFLHARHRETNTKLGLRSSNAISGGSMGGARESGGTPYLAKQKSGPKGRHFLSQV